MKKLLLIILVIPTAFGAAQNSNKDLNELHQQIVNQQKQMDSNLKKMDSFNANILIQAGSIDSLVKARDMESISRNMDGLMREMKERENQQRRNSYIRIGIGLLILAFGVFAFLRRRKPKSE